MNACFSNVILCAVLLDERLSQCLPRVKSLLESGWVKSLVHCSLEQLSIAIIIKPSTSLSTSHFLSTNTSLNIPEIHTLELVLIERVLFFAFQKLSVVVFSTCRKVVISHRTETINI